MCQRGQVIAPMHTRRSDHYGPGKCTVDAVEQHPRPLLGHACVACGGRDRAGVADGFEQLGLAGADPCAGFKSDAYSETCYSCP